MVGVPSFSIRMINIYNVNYDFRGVLGTTLKICHKPIRSTSQGEGIEQICEISTRLYLPMYFA